MKAAKHDTQDTTTEPETTPARKPRTISRDPAIEAARSRKNALIKLAKLKAALSANRLKHDELVEDIQVAEAELRDANALLAAATAETGGAS